MLIDYYACLGLEQGQDYKTKELVHAWHVKCIEHHPDKGGDAEKFKEVTHAYEMITSPEYRKKYKESTPDPRTLDVRIQLAVNFEDAFFGSTFNVSYGVNTLDTDGFVVLAKPDVKVEINTLTIKVKPGTVNNEEHLFPKEGLRTVSSKERGDVIINIMVKPSVKFQLRGMDTVAEELIPLDIMLKGGSVTVQTMYGLKEVLVRPGTKPDSELSVEGCGVNKFGCHIVVAKPEYPDMKELKNNKSWKSLDINWDNQEDEVDTKTMEYEKIFEGMNPVFTFKHGGVHVKRRERR